VRRCGAGHSEEYLREQASGWRKFGPVESYRCPGLRRFQPVQRGAGSEKRHQPDRGRTIGFCRLSKRRALAKHDRPRKAMVCPTCSGRSRAGEEFRYALRRARHASMKVGVSESKMMTRITCRSCAARKPPGPAGSQARSSGRPQPMPPHTLKGRNRRYGHLADSGHEGGKGADDRHETRQHNGFAAVAFIELVSARDVRLLEESRVGAAENFGARLAPQQIAGGIAREAAASTTDLLAGSPKRRTRHHADSEEERSPGRKNPTSRPGFRIHHGEQRREPAQPASNVCSRWLSRSGSVSDR